MERNVPEYVSRSVPVPLSSRVPWYKSTFPSYFGIFLFVGYYLKLAEPTLGFASPTVVLWGLVVAGLLCFGLYYYVPAMVHTGPGVPFALPALCIPAARKYPDLKIILAHAGFAVFTAEAQVAASVCGNLYLETSWCIGEDIRWMIDTIGADRVMLGADLPSNVPVEYAKYKALELKPDVYDKVLGGTAIDVFKLKW